MMDGRTRCNKLKSIRKGLADKLGVDLHQTECTYEGECRGTCPKCKQEEQILNRAILQKGTAVAGATAIAASLAACTPLGKQIPAIGNGGDDLSGDVAYVDGADDIEGRKTPDGSEKDGGDDIVELSGEVAEPYPEDDDCDGKDCDTSGDGKCEDKDCDTREKDGNDIPDELSGMAELAPSEDSTLFPEG